MRACVRVCVRACVCVRVQVCLLAIGGQTPGPIMAKFGTNNSMRIDLGMIYILIISDPEGP